MTTYTYFDSTALEVGDFFVKLIIKISPCVVGFDDSSVPIQNGEPVDYVRAKVRVNVSGDEFPNALSENN